MLLEVLKVENKAKHLNQNHVRFKGCRKRAVNTLYILDSAFLSPPSPCSWICWRDRLGSSFTFPNLLCFFVCLFICLFLVFPPKLALAKEALLFGFYFGYFFFLPKSIIPI